MTNPKGKRDQIIEDLITIQKRDTLINSFTHYFEEQINFSAEDNALNPQTPLPCRSVTLYDYTPAIQPCTGGMTKTYTAKGRIITYYDPTNYDPDLPSLDLMGEKAEEIFDKTKIEDNWLNGTTENTYNIKKYTFKKTYKYPYLVTAGNYAKKLADTIITLFELEIEVNIL